MSSGTDEYWRIKRRKTEKNRLEILQIIDELAKSINKYPNQRFDQVLTNLGMKNFEKLKDTEPDVLLKLIKENQKQFKL